VEVLFKPPPPQLLTQTIGAVLEGLYLPSGKVRILAVPVVVVAATQALLTLVRTLISLRAAAVVAPAAAVTEDRAEVLVALPLLQQLTQQALQIFLDAARAALAVPAHLPMVRAVVHPVVVVVVVIIHQALAA
jgi:hypothetical protein